MGWERDEAKLRPSTGIPWNKGRGRGMDWDLGKGSILLGQEEKTLGRKCNLRWKPQPRPDRGVPWRMATKTAAGQITGTELSWTGNTRLFTTNWAL